MVALDASGNVHKHSNVARHVQTQVGKNNTRQQRRPLSEIEKAVSAKTVSKALVRREIKATRTAEAVFNRMSKEALPLPVINELKELAANFKALTQNLEEGKQDTPCDPRAVAAVQLKITNPKPASELPDGGVEQDDPCSKLAKQLTPSIAYGHVVIKEPDGNTSQVPNENEDETWHEKIANNNILMMIFDGIFYLAVLGALGAIIMARISADKKAKKDPEGERG